MSDRAQGYAHPAVSDYDRVDMVANLRNTPVRNFTGTYHVLVPVATTPGARATGFGAGSVGEEGWCVLAPVSGGDPHRSPSRPAG